MLIKQRVARKHEGRSGGFRTIIAYRRGARAVFLHVIEKSRQANLDPVELETYQNLAKTFDRMTEAQLDELVKHRGWRRIKRKKDEKDLSQ